MPPTEKSVEDQLIPSEELSQERWVELLEIRRRRFAPELKKSFKLDVLGDLACLANTDFPEAEVRHQTFRESGFFDLCLKYQGIFGHCRMTASHHQYPSGEQCGEFYVWGLMRSGEWELFLVTVRRVDRLPSGYREEVIGVFPQRPRDIRDILRVTGISPWAIWRILTGASSQVVRRRETLLDRAEAFHLETLVEDRILKAASAS